MNTCYVLIFTFAFICINQVYCSSDKKIVSARVESCAGCQLNRLTEVKQFIYEDLPKYENVEFKKIPGAPPELVFFNAAEEEVDRVELKPLSRMDCNELLQNRGFKFIEKNEL